MLNVRFSEISPQASGDEAVVQRPAAARPGRRNFLPAGARDKFYSLHCTTTTTTTTAAATTTNNNNNSSSSNNNNNNNNNKRIHGTEFFMRS
jgi:hypothetical protein